MKRVRSSESERRRRDHMKTDRYKLMRRKYTTNPKTWPIRACVNIKSKCKKEGVSFDMRPEDIQVPAVCPFTLLPFDFSGSHGRQAPSVDRIKPDRGYIRGNVRVISLQANSAKCDITDPAIFQRLADDARLWGLV
jgi:hypothetical protein